MWPLLETYNSRPCYRPRESPEEVVENVGLHGSCFGTATNMTTYPQQHPALESKKFQLWGSPVE